ncbi:hypothetical protein [Peribacillus frigoritolerans]|uniref:hypothetical protein n=1 Tax=Peribacillus frigoritolerans TaxID=450367 RepID=UPI002282B1E6|nr:hypothetical protein [Peribacillus frigoritolerans]MCY9007125.1 hypothetical protein [Peribacillus frigoritolerans]
MRVQAEYVKFEQVGNRLLPQREHSYEIVEIDETQGKDLDELVNEALSEKLRLSKDKYKFMNAKKL